MERGSGLPRGGRRAPGGFTLTELLVVIGLVAILIGLLIPVLMTVYSTSNSVRCFNNLRQINIGFVAYAGENNSLLPDPLANNTSWEASLLPYVIKREVFACPSDEELFPNLGSSYDWRDTGFDNSTMAGQSLSDINRTDAVLAFDSLPGWHEPRKMNILLVDGSTDSWGQMECFKDLMQPIRGNPPGAVVLGASPGR